MTPLKKFLEAAIIGETTKILRLKGKMLWANEYLAKHQPRVEGFYKKLSCVLFRLRRFG